MVIADKIGNVGIAAACLTLMAMIVRSFLEFMKVIPCGCGNIINCEEEKGCVPISFEFTMENRLWKDFLNNIIIAISVIVCAIPEGLPLAVTISLSFSSNVMKEKGNLVRKLESSETMGSANYICTDKTGTLTMNQMTVMALMCNNEAHMVP